MEFLKAQCLVQIKSDEQEGVSSIRRIHAAKIILRYINLDIGLVKIIEFNYNVENLFDGNGGKMLD